MNEKMKYKIMRGRERERERTKEKENYFIASRMCAGWFIEHRAFEMTFQNNKDFCGTETENGSIQELFLYCIAVYTQHKHTIPHISTVVFIP